MNRIESLKSKTVLSITSGGGKYVFNDYKYILTTDKKLYFIATYTGNKEMIKEMNLKNSYKIIKKFNKKEYEELLNKIDLYLKDTDSITNKMYDAYFRINLNTERKINIINDREKYNDIKNILLGKEIL